jgi:hypothetical protein
MSFAKINLPKKCVFFYLQQIMSGRHELMVILLAIGVAFFVLALVLSAMAAEETRKKNSSKAYQFAIAASVSNALGIVLVGVAAGILLLDYSGLLEQNKERGKVEGVLNHFVKEQIEKSTCTNPIPLKEILALRGDVCPK